MINIDNLKYLLESLNFKSKNDVYSKHYNDNDAFLNVDLKKQEIIYPEEKGLTINERQTCNFKANENFVVFECIHRLLEKGYKPEHIELEPKWKLGHGASGGRADILIKDNAGKALLIIECKTAGSEFKKAWNKTLQDGDQLFSYAQQISETQFLCLYSSDFDSDTLTYQSHIIAHRDNEKYLADNPLFKGFKDVSDVKGRFTVWRDTYKLDYTTKGIFEDNIQPYHIGKDKYTLADLQGISATDQQKKYHEFATILRQHNVSGRENAFDKLVNLFLCKLVDETENPDELKFYWKGVAYDTHFELLDRLQQLYQAGMGKFLGEDITYINQNDVNNALRFIRQNPDATQRAVWNLFVQQKFFTNNDFSFIDVHNERLFYQNAEVLLKILQMWQDIRLTGDNSNNQFLGDMFEGFLDQGVKQSEGQYFTPMPICRFILMSLPLTALVKGSATPSKAIDYACGAGHFLNELALQIKPLVEQHKQGNLADYHKAIYGMEKEYRLSKVAKVSAFMYGQQEINICYGDALINQHPAFPEIKDNSFDLLVANPPYSVRGFLETLPEEERSKYTLSDTIDKLDTNNSIETFFIERAKQLLKAGGVAAIILPSSILNNGNNTYITTRSILLKYFDIVAIAEFGSGTFGKTGTNTVTLFLRRKATTPDTAEHYRERVDDWFNSDDDQQIYQDAHLIDQYAAHIGAVSADYKTLLSGTPNAALLTHDTFVQYRTAFDASTEIVNLKKQKGFKAKSVTEQMAELEKRFLVFVRNIEQDKLYHFVLASQQPNQVLIIKSPTDTKEQKQFLGYEWSSAKGGEGIKIIKDAQGHHQTPLYDETNRDNLGKINRYIANNFDGTQAAIPAELSDYATTARLVDMLDFSRVIFEKQIGLAEKKTNPIISKWPLTKLGDIAEIKKGKSITQKDVKPGNVKVVAGGMDFAYHHNESNRPHNTITISASGANAGYVNYWNEEIFASDCSTVRGADDEHTEYIFNALQSRQDEIYSFARGAAQPHVYPKDVEQLLIPAPDSATQRQIVIECQTVNTEITTALASINTARQTVEIQVDAVYSSTTPHLEIDKLSLSVQYGLSEKMNEGGIGYKIFRMNEIIQGRMADNGSMKCADISAEEFAKYRLNKGDVLFNRTNSIEHVGKTGLFELEGNYCFASYLVRVVPDQKQVLPLFLTLMMNSKTFQQEAKGKASKSINQANINATIMRNIKVPVPPIAEQKRLVAKVEKLEKQIAQAQAVIAAAPARKQAIMQKYL
ncbi:MAG: restriction endonuclease subunit S [Geobacteraceae bacterium]|nr:restriction endonuclease subunit S [Geobacteraceae bacterium]